MVGSGDVPIIKQICVIAVNYAMIKWFSCVYAALNNRNIIMCADVVFGIKVVEKVIVPRLFNKLLKQQDFLSKTIKLLFENPSLIRTMLSK